MNINEAIYVGSYPSVDLCPPPAIPEYAFIGRSNVGKSSLINMISGRKNLAKTSATPGKTQLINFFLINNKWHLVDLPGYGYAKVSKDKRSGFEKMIRQYLTNRKSLMTLFILVDIRIEPQKSDLEFIKRTGESNIPLAIVFTKTDKLSARQLQMNIDQFSEGLKENWEVLPDYFITSSVSKNGKDDLLKFMAATNKLF